MKVICAPDKFRGSLTAIQAARAMATGVLKVRPDAQVDLCPVADGGEGTAEVLAAAMGGRRMISPGVPGPRFDLGQKVSPRWWFLPKYGSQPATALLEMASASGLASLAPRQRDPTHTTSYGTGVLIRKALDAGAKRVFLGIGGSATADGGCGAAMALGARFFNRHGKLIRRPITGGMLRDIARIDLAKIDPRLRGCSLIIGSDVSNPLTGRHGAARVYGPQKGATPAQVRALDAGLTHLARVIRRQGGGDVNRLIGSGAAGGMGMGAVVFLGGRWRRGAELVLEALDFDRRVAGCDLCLTGEGRLDRQTSMGKAVDAVVKAATRSGVRCVALVGSAEPGAKSQRWHGLSSCEEIGYGLSTRESMRRAAQLVEHTAARIIAGR